MSELQRDNLEITIGILRRLISIEKIYSRSLFVRQTTRYHELSRRLLYLENKVS
jgi:hypothetical protein